MRNGHSTEDVDGVVVVRHKFKAGRNAVFDAWLDERCVAQWAGRGKSDAVAVRIDARVGGEFDNEYYDAKLDETWLFRGIFREIDRGRRLQFLFWWCGEENRRYTPGVVTIDFREIENETEVSVTHSGIETEEEKELLRGKWTRDLERMAEHLKKSGRRFRWTRFFFF